MDRLEKGRLLSWASEIDEGTLEQAAKTARLPIIHNHVSLMPDAHVGIGATVGSVIPTQNAIIPAAVGVDIGCGMIAVETDLFIDDVDVNTDKLHAEIAKAVPAGVGQGHGEVSIAAATWLAKNEPWTILSDKQVDTVLAQFGTLGSGNHFLELCADERDKVWMVLHSGSRGIGNQLATMHIDRTKKGWDFEASPLEDPNLAWLKQGTPEFNAYIDDMIWAQDYALANRETMMNNALAVFFAANGRGAEVDRINCHHNFAQLELHGEIHLWVTRKGAIQADLDDRGVIPGSMGTRSYVVKGLGNKDSWNSCSHGAGRRLSRSKARKTLSVESFREAMEGVAWQESDADVLLDEHPAAYKSIEQVMEDQKDLVEILHTLKQWFSYKGR